MLRDFRSPKDNSNFTFSVTKMNRNPDNALPSGYPRQIVQKTQWKNYVPDVYLMCGEVTGGRIVEVSIQGEGRVPTLSFQTESCISNQLPTSITLVEYDREFKIQVIMVRYKDSCQLYRIRGDLVFEDDCLLKCKNPKERSTLLKLSSKPSTSWESWKNGWKFVRVSCIVIFSLSYFYQILAKFVRN